MTIDDLKSLMDGFDPAALLPQIDTVLGKIELVTRVAVVAGPVIVLALGLLYFFLAPKEANYRFGYRCYFGMGSVNAWRFTQRLAGMVWSALGLMLTVVMLLVCGSFRGKDAVDMLAAALTCLAWQAGLVLLSSLAINVVAAVFFDSKGERRKK